MKNKVIINLSLTLTCALMFASVFAGPLHDAVKSGDVNQIWAAALEVQNINELDEQGRPALLYLPDVSFSSSIITDIGQKLDVIRFFGNNLDFCDSTGRTLLHILTERYIEYKKSAPVLVNNATNFNDLRAMFAFGKEKGGVRRLVIELIKLGANPNTAMPNGITPLHIAAGGSTYLTRILVLGGANVNARDSWKNTPLHDAAANRKKKNYDILCGNKKRLGSPAILRHLGSKFFRHTMVAADTGVENSQGHTSDDVSMFVVPFYTGQREMNINIRQ